MYKIYIDLHVGTKLSLIFFHVKEINDIRCIKYDLNFHQQIELFMWSSFWKLEQIILCYCNISGSKLPCLEFYNRASRGICPYSFYS